MSKNTETTRSPAEPLLDDIIPPQLYPTEAEEGVIAALLFGGGPVMEAIYEILRPNHFHHEAHRLVFQAAVEVFQAKGDVSMESIAHQLQITGNLEKVGGYVGLQMIAARPASLVLSGVVANAMVVREAALRRYVLRWAEHAAKSALREDPEALVQTLLDTLSRMNPVPDHRVMHVGEALDAALSHLEAVSSGEVEIGIKTGFPDLDELTGGLHRGELFILAARPAMGKTALGLQIAANVAKGGYPTLFFSIEMPTESLIHRLVAQNSRYVPLKVLRRGTTNDAAWQNIMAVASQIAEWPLYIDDTAGIDITTLRSRIHAMKRTHDIAVVVVDYAQLVRARRTVGYHASRFEEVSYVARALKNIAHHYDVAVLALAQLNREVERRAENRPRLADLRESGEFENAADTIAFLWREDPQDRERVTLTIAKQRQGPLGDIPLLYNGEHTAFFPVHRVSL